MYSKIERLGWNVKREEGGEGCVREERVYLRDGWFTFKCSSAPPSSSFLPLPPPQCSRRRYEKVIMFPLEMSRSPSAPFISKWNNLSTVAFVFFSIHLHLSFQYTTPAPLFLFLAFSYSFFFLPLSLLPSDSLIRFSSPFVPCFFLVLSIIRAVHVEHALSVSALDMVLLPQSSVIIHSTQLLCKVGIRRVHEQAFPV